MYTLNRHRSDAIMVEILAFLPVVQSRHQLRLFEKLMDQ
ncbi:hypothetical protein [Methylomonas albis]|nr:hypothetical protein [Methylomonas albis]